MIVKKTLKNGKTAVTSSYFEDMRLYRQSLSESKSEDYVAAKWRREKGRDFSELELQTAIQVIKLGKMAVSEISSFRENLRPGQLDNYKFNFGPMEDYESYESLCEQRDALEPGSEEYERVCNKIANIDNFVATNIEALKAAE